MANAVSNFVNGIANGAKQVVLDPIVDLGALAAKGVNKGLDLVTGDNLSQYTNQKISKAAEGIKAQAASPVDPTSTAYAAGEGLVHGVDNAAMALGLVQLAKQVGKQGLKKLPKLLGKYQDAKDKKAQLQAAQEIKEYIQKQAKSPTVVTSDVPAYQQKAYANEWNANNSVKMDTFKDLGGNQSVFPKRNLTDQFRQVDKVYTNPTSKDIAKNNIIKERGEFPATIRNDLDKAIANRKWVNKAKRYDRVNLTPQERTAAIQAEEKTNAALKAGWDPEVEPFDLYF